MRPEGPLPCTMARSTCIRSAQGQIPKQAAYAVNHTADNARPNDDRHAHRWSLGCSSSSGISAGMLLGGAQKLGSSLDRHGTQLK